MSDEFLDEKSSLIPSSSGGLARLNDSIVKRGLDLATAVEQATKARRELVLANACLKQAESVSGDPTAWDTHVRACRDAFSHALLAIASHLQMDRFSGPVELVKYLQKRSKEVPAGTPPRGFPGLVPTWVEGFDKLVRTIDADREAGHRMWTELSRRGESVPFALTELLEYATELVERPVDAIARASPDPASFHARPDGRIEVTLPPSVVRFAELVYPALKNEITEGTVVRWLKSPGDFVDCEETLCILSISDVPLFNDWPLTSPAAGVLAAVLVNEGQAVAISGTLCLIERTEKVSASSNS